MSERGVNYFFCEVAEVISCCHYWDFCESVRDGLEWEGREEDGLEGRLSVEEGKKEGNGYSAEYI